MRQTVVGIFTQQASAEATLRRLQMRGFEVECVGGTRQPADAREPVPGIKARWRWLFPFSQAPRQGEVQVKVHANSVLEAQAAREILRASGARQSGCLGEGWTNWNW